MEFVLDDDQLMLRRTVREVLAKYRSRGEGEQWDLYRKLGWLEVPPVELALILEELSYVADTTPFLASATWFAPLAGRLPDGAGAAVFDGTGRYVLDGDRADEVAVRTADGVRVVRAAELTVEPVEVFDPTLHVAHVRVPDAVDAVPDLALMGLAATAVGSCRRILDLTVAHVKERHQFGRPLGAFQAVKHKAADMYVAIERARALTHFSALTLAEGDERRRSAAHMAKAAAGECQRLVFRHGLQLFGAMGFTWENELQVHLKRAKSCDLLLGTAATHRKALLIR
ncbi:acyl-CoA dehydrogenase family protein [Streptomyces sp. NPDC005373]|uniref:acyl-CoA dehydrogenase family protein n=1 Tax=Streptomyces sp. NPDC005373 TaxID=3156879 RepID=UPI0033BD77A5